MFEVVHEATVLVLVNVKKHAGLVFDRLEGADVVDHTRGPPTIEEVSALVCGDADTVLG